MIAAFKSQDTYAMLSAELLVERSRHDLSSDVRGGIEVSLALNATRRRDHLDEYVCCEEDGGRWWWVVWRVMMTTKLVDALQQANALTLLHSS